MPHWLYCLSILSGGLWNREFFKAEGTQHLKRCVKMPPHFLISQAFPSGPTYLQVRGTVFQKLGMGIPLWRLGFLWRPVILRSTYGVSCTGPEVGLDDSHGPLPTLDILWHPTQHQRLPATSWTGEIIYWPWNYSSRRALGSLSPPCRQ